MKRTPGRQPYFFAFLCLSLCAGSLSAQTTSSDWFRKGLDTASAAERVQAFERAVQIDPDYIEAYFYLGLAYKNAARFDDAEIALGKAYYKNPYGLNDDIKLRILLELGTVQTVLGKSEDARETFLTARNLAGGSPDLKGRVLYELGRIYLQLEHYEAAIEELQHGKTLLPQNTSLFDKAIAEARQKKSVYDKYVKGISLLKTRRYGEAVAAFQTVVALQSDFKDIQSKLEEARRGRSASAQPARSVTARPDPRPRAQPKKAVIDDVAQNYRRGVAALQKREWAAAIRALTAVSQSRRDYENVQALLKRARAALRAEADMEEKSKQLYERGMAYIAAREWRAALTAFKELRNLNPGYKDVNAELTKIKIALTVKQTTAAIDSAYQSGLLALQNGDWLQAVVAFERVGMQQADYKDVNRKLADAKFNLARKTGQATPEKSASSSNTILWVGVTVALFLLPAIWALIFIPGLRAHLLLLQGQYQRAAEIYEQILEKRPEKVKLYPILANIYLLEDRRDEASIKIFEAILKLNMLTNKRDEITSLVANYYMRNKRTDGGAIAIMERELNNKIKNGKDSAV